MIKGTSGMRKGKLIVTALIGACGVYYPSGCVSLISLETTKISPQTEKQLESLVQPSRGDGPDVSKLSISTEDAKTVVKLTSPISGKYFFAAKINGVATDIFLDWGSEATMGLTPSHTIKTKARLSDKNLGVHTLDSEERCRLGTLDTMEFSDGLTIKDVPFFLSNTDIKLVLVGWFPLFRGEAMAGMPFLAAFKKFAVDFDKKLLYLGALPAELSTNPEVRTLPFEYKNASITIRVDLEGSPYEAVADVIGFTSYVALYGESAKKFMASHQSRLTGYTTGFGSKQVSNFEATVEKISTNNYTLQNVPVTLTPDTKINVTALVGTAFFGGKIVGVDFDRKTISFIPRAPAGNDVKK